MQPYMMSFFVLFYSINLIRVFISIMIWLIKKIILIKKFSKRNWKNISSFDIKYFDIHLSLDFLIFIFRYH
jgi:hypothetical protein